MRMRALQRLGHDVRGVNTVEPWLRARWLARQIERRLQFGHVVDEINRSVLKAARAFRPDLIWAEKQEFLRRDTVEALRALGACTVHFTPDPYFSLPWKRTRMMDTVIGAFDVLVYCKAYEEADYQGLGRPTIYMPLGYCDEMHRPLHSDNPQWECTAGFLGGWEPRRELLLREVAGVVDLKIRGAHWEFLRDGKWTLRRHVILSQFAGEEPFRIKQDQILAAAHQGGEVYGDDYARALTGARIGLGFLRKVCPDQHTTRTFEIPACGSMLLADRTAEHEGFFSEGKEAEFFSSTEELVEKVRFYGGNPDARKRIAKAGLQRCVTGRYAYIHRLSDALLGISRL
jgi:hypothetical protein